MSEGAPVYRVEGRAVSLALCGDGRDWARLLLARIQAGEKRSPTVVRFAHEGLGLLVPSAKGRK
jgi:hypothetical protein